MALCACVLLAAAGIVLGQGFLAVAVLPQRRVTSGTSGLGLSVRRVATLITNLRI